LLKSFDLLAHGALRDAKQRRSACDASTSRNGPEVHQVVEIGASEALEAIGIIDGIFHRFVIAEGNARVKYTKEILEQSDVALCSCSLLGITR
jgi:succinylarginine dihydrolase